MSQPDSLTRRNHRPQPGKSLTASATRITTAKLKGGTYRGGSAESWQNDAWQMYDLVGEQRFLANTLAGRLAQARLFVGRKTPDPLDAPELVEDEAISELTDWITNQILNRLGINLFVAGDGWLAGIPTRMVEQPEQPTDLPPSPLVPDQPEDEGVDLKDLTWRMLSVEEVSFNSGAGEVTLTLDENKKLTARPDDLYLIRVWRPHPRKWWEADSPTRSSLPVLRELVGLTMHVAAQIDSRLAGAGLFLIPEEAQRALKAQIGESEDGEGTSDDPLMDSLIEAMLTPIKDRESASALVPLGVTVPGETIENFRHISFSSGLDEKAQELRTEAIRRLALGQDAPPELLLGSAGMNHWGAWLVREDVVTTHLEPPLALICDALTTQYLHPILEAMGYSEEEAKDLVIWYDVDHMIQRPNRSTDAKELHAAGVINDDALRDATGFDEQDAPTQVDTVMALALDLVKSNPGLLASPGLAEVVAQIRAAMDGEDTTATAPPTSPPAASPPAAEGPPATDGQAPLASADTSHLVPGGREVTLPNEGQEYVRPSNAPFDWPTAAQLADEYEQQSWEDADA